MQGSGHYCNGWFKKLLFFLGYSAIHAAERVSLESEYDEKNFLELALTYSENTYCKFDKIRKADIVLNNLIHS